MPKEKLMIVYKLDALGVGPAIQGVRTVLTGHRIPLEGFTLYEEPLAFDDILAKLAVAKRKTFNIFGQGLVFDFGCVRNFGLEFLEITKGNVDDISWDQWALQFLGRSSFVMAWVSNVEYDFWQNAQDPLQFTANGKSFEHLPMKSNGLPYPLERTIIDISHNPGRRLLRSGYYEAIGALMWLGEPFWQLTGAVKAEIERAGWLRIDNFSSSVLRIEAAPQCFTSGEGVSGELQRRLRSCLFPESRVIENH